jgi:uncharacterized SAM-binding protein YcdF (DUF218 family)
MGPQPTHMPLIRDLKPGRRWTIILLALATLAAVIAASLPDVRQSLLRSAGWALVAQDPPAKADIIVVASDAIGAGVLEGADLVRAGYASRVAIFELSETRVTREFARRGLRALDLTTFNAQILHALGVTDIVMIPAVVGTEDEGKVLQKWCAANSIHSILFVSTADHSRRTRRVLDRALGQHGVHVTLRYARFSEFDPDSWWRTRGGQRVQAVESQKLLLDFVRHPF